MFSYDADVDMDPFLRNIALSTLFWFTTPIFLAIFHRKPSFLQKIGIQPTSKPQIETALWAGKILSSTLHGFILSNFAAPLLWKLKFAREHEYFLGEFFFFLALGNFLIKGKQQQLPPTSWINCFFGMSKEICIFFRFEYE